MKSCRTRRTAISYLLSREIRLAALGPWALPRHRLSVGRTRVAGAGLGAGCRVRGLTGPGAADVEADREVFVTSINMDRACDISNPQGQIFSRITINVSRLQGAPVGLATAGDERP